MALARKDERSETSLMRLAEPFVREWYGPLGESARKTFYPR